MSIAEKLTAVVENVPKVHEAGYTEGYGRGYEFGDEMGYFRGKEEGYNLGKAEGGNLLDDIQQNGSREEYDYIFTGYYWTPDNFKPRYTPIKPTRAVGTFMYAANLNIDISEIVDFSNCLAMSNTFNESAITKVGTINAVQHANGSITYAFLNARKLKTIEKIIVSESTIFTQAFDNCASLEDVAFEGTIGTDISFKSSPKLTAESIISVVEHLSDTATGKTVTLNMTAVSNALWSGTEYDSWEELKATKLNWTFKNESGTAI